MASEQLSSLKSKKPSSSTSRTNDSDTQWLLIPNNLELGARPKPSKKQRNKEKHKQLLHESLAPSNEMTDCLSNKPRSSFHLYPRVKSNTATWVKDQYMTEEKSKRTDYESDGFSDGDFLPHQQNVHFPAYQAFPDIEQEHQAITSRSGGENENIKSVKDELRKNEVCDMLSHIHKVLTETKSSWEKLDFDDPIIKDVLVKLKNAFKDGEGGRENKLSHHTEGENGYATGMSRSSSTSRVSNSKENIGNRDTENTILCRAEDEQGACGKCPPLEEKMFDDKMESPSSDESISVKAERLSSVERERCRKLKNYLIELKKQHFIKDAMNREFIFLKDAADISKTAALTQRTKERKKKKLGKLQSSSQQVKQTKGVAAYSQTTSLETDTPVAQLASSAVSRHSQSSTMKRDNVRKEQNSAFPARRHYEAEGRANEDADIPAASAPIASPPPHDSKIGQKTRKLKGAQKHRKVITDVIQYMLEEARKSGVSINVEKLMELHLSSIEKANQCISKAGSDEYYDFEKEFYPAVHPSSSQPSATNVKEVCCDGIKSTLLDVDRHKDTEEVDADNIEVTAGIKEDIEVKRALSEFHHFMQLSPEIESDVRSMMQSSDRKTDHVRSSGEGAYTFKKIPVRNVTSESAQKIHYTRRVPRQDNLQLTRQNIVSMESQNQNSNSNFHNRDCNSVKKDINNLSGKMGKLSIQNSMNSSYPDVVTASNNNMDSMSTLSCELNQNHSLSNEIDCKLIFDNLKQDKKQLRKYDQNHDTKICCNSSTDSEHLEGSNSALAVDSTTLAAWGGSSTQENCEEEEQTQAESLDEEEESMSVFDKRSLEGPNVSTAQFSGQFLNMKPSIPTHIPDKRQRNLHQPTYNRISINTPPVEENFQHLSQPVRPVRQQMSSSSTAAGLARDPHNNPVCISDTAEHCHQNPSLKFIQELKNHVDQLNALCQSHMYHERTLSTNSVPSQSYSHMSNPCAPLQPASEIPLPYNQQLLLCLSQCYHNLYMQQLEIHHLQRCMWHNTEGENPHQQHHLNTRHGQEDPNFRPYCLLPWSMPFSPSCHILPDQIPPLPSAAYLHLPMKHYPNQSSNSYASSSGTQPARAVIHPTSQNNTPSQETLNNQVPPRTRANNFWDNFRSYSRQNLLSTSNTAKRNENVVPGVTPQVRQVYPLVNGSPNRASEASNTCCASSSFPDYNRTAPSLEEIATKNTKCKAPVTGTTGIHKRDVPMNINTCTARNIRTNLCHQDNLEPAPLQSTTNYSSNLIQPLSSLFQENSKLEHFTTVAPNSLSQSTLETPPIAVAATNPTPGLSSVFEVDDYKSDFLRELLCEAQALKSKPVHQTVLKMIRDLAKNETHDNEDMAQAKIQNDCSHGSVECEKVPVILPTQRCSKISRENDTLLSETVESEKSSFLLLSDNASANIQNLPTAAIPPLSKHGTPRTVSTGAVRKKTKILSTNFPDLASASLTSLQDSSNSTPDIVESPMEPNKTMDEVLPSFITEKVVSDFVAILPSLKKRYRRDGCAQTFWTSINDCLLESLGAHLSCCYEVLSQQSILQMRKSVGYFISLLRGSPNVSKRIPHLSSGILKSVENFIYGDVTYYIELGQFPVSTFDEENFILAIAEKKKEMNMKTPIDPVEIKSSVRADEEPSEPINIKMPARIPEEPDDIVKVLPVAPEDNINFSSQCGPVPQQNILNYDNFVPEASIQIQDVLFQGQEHEDLICDCNPEAEIEPEVEIGTEADLAEADQSPGQQGSSITEVIPQPEHCSLDHEAVLFHRNSGAVLLMNDDENRDIEDLSEGATGVQLCPELRLDQEVLLDDIPTKLCPSEEELSQQIKDDHPIQLPSDETVAPFEYVAENIGDGASTHLR